MKRDPYNNKERWIKWKERNKKKIPDISLNNSKIVLEFLNDMEQGMNTTPRNKGRREPTTLINLKDHIIFILKYLKKPIQNITKKDLHNLENKIREGKILKKNGQIFTAFGNYIKDFKSFCGWLVRTGKIEYNISEDLSKKTNKPKWVYLGEQKIKKFFNLLSFDYKALSFLMYDSGMRVTEAYSIKVKSFSDDFKKLTIPDEVSKTFGRTINLKLCSDLIKEFIKVNNLGPEDYIFIKNTHAFNKYLKENCKKIFGDGVTKAGKKYSDFTLYDIRHNSSCYWLKRYNSNKGMMYRLGWKREDEIFYYSEFLGMNDEITDEDMVLREDKDKLVEMEKRLKDTQSEMKRIEELVVHLANKKVKTRYYEVHPEGILARRK